jgi:hypothetical protein
MRIAQARLTGVATLLVIGLFTLSPLLATVAFASTASISRSYSSKQSIINGSLVSLDTTATKSVVPANRTNSDKLVGVAVGDNDSLVAIGPSGSTVQVAITGVVSTLVSTVNGPIKIGDQVAVSPFSGIGMGTEPNTRIIGLAQTALNSSSPNLTKREVTDKDGKKQTIEVGYIQVNIAIGPPSADSHTNDSFLKQTARSLTGKDVSTTRVVISTAIALIALVALVTLIYSSVYATIIAIGRNPLAKRAVFRTLLTVMVMALVTATVAIAVIYLVLR